MKKIMVWTADKDMKVNMIFTVEWTTWAVEKEAEKNQAWLGIEPWPLTGRNALSTDLIKAAGEQAIVSSCHTRWWKLHELKYTKWIMFCTFIVEKVNAIMGSFYVSLKLPTYPSPKPTLTLSSYLGRNVGLGEG